MFFESFFFVRFAFVDLCYFRGVKIVECVTIVNLPYFVLNVLYIVNVNNQSSMYLCISIECTFPSLINYVAHLLR